MIIRVPIPLAGAAEVMVLGVFIDQPTEVILADLEYSAPALRLDQEPKQLGVGVEDDTAPQEPHRLSAEAPRTIVKSGGEELSRS